MHITPENQFSFWETQTYFSNIDLVVVGSGIVGLSTAIYYKKQYPKAKIIILERGILPYGASTKNAGFACFGSVSELKSDINKSNEDTVWQTVELRVKGLELLRKTLGDKNIEYKEYGGYELFSSPTKFESCCSEIEYFNKKLQSITKTRQTYKISNKHIDSFGFETIKGIILNTKEGQIDTGKMMKNLIGYAIAQGISA